MKFKLIEDGSIISILKVKKLESYCLEAEVCKAISWDENGEVLEEEFFAEVYIKWDGCSHIYFKGEDKKDSYYHLCGGVYFIEHMQTMAFIAKVAKENIKNFEDEYGNFSSIEKYNILEGCKIERVEEGDE